MSPAHMMSQGVQRLLGILDRFVRRRCDGPSSTKSSNRLRFFGDLGFNDTDPRPGFSACPDFAVIKCRLFLTPPSTWCSRMLAYVYFPLTTIGPACPTTWRPPNRGAIGFCSRCALYAFWDLSPPLPAASVQAAEP